MSSNTKVGLTLVVAIVLIGIAAYVYTPQESAIDSELGNSAEQTTTTTTTTTGSNATPSDTTDSALLKDSAAIDAQMSALDKDNTSMAQSDQAVTQSY
ncbi:MAG: hypothetical protein JWN18_247 [Parcubacteria group bacterium]|nr:hypothetical protein [Parcubacteria group bacterium]